MAAPVNQRDYRITQTFSCITELIDGQKLRSAINMGLFFVHIRLQIYWESKHNINISEEIWSYTKIYIYDISLESAS